MTGLRNKLLIIGLHRPLNIKYNLPRNGSVEREFRVRYSTASKILTDNTTGQDLDNNDIKLNQHDETTKQQAILDRVLNRNSDNLVVFPVSTNDVVVQKQINRVAKMTSIVFLNHLKAAEHDEKRLIMWRAFSERAKQLASEMSAESLVFVIHLFGLKRLRDSDCLSILIRHVVPALPSLNNDALVQFVFGLSRLKARSDEAFKAAAREIAGRATEMNPRQLGEIMFSYATLKYLHPYLHDVLRIQLIERSKTLKPRDLTLVLQSLSLLRLQKDRKLFVSIVGQANRIITEFSGPQLSAVLNSYANFQVEHPLCLEVIHNELFLKINDLDPQCVASVINSAARLPALNSHKLISQLADKLTVEGHFYGLDSICLVTAGLSSMRDRIPVLKPRLPKLFETLGRRVGQLSLQLTPRHVASLVYSFAKANVRFEPLFYHSLIHLERFISQYSCDQIGMIIRGLSKLDLCNHVVTNIVLNSLDRFIVTEQDYPLQRLTSTYMRERPPIDDSPKDGNKENDQQLNDDGIQKIVGFPPRPMTLVWILEFFAQWNISNTEKLEILAHQLTLRSRELSPPLCVRALVAWSTIHRGDMPLVLSLLEQIRIGWSDFWSYEKSKASFRNIMPQVKSRNGSEIGTVPIMRILETAETKTDEIKSIRRQEWDYNFSSPPPLTFKQTVVLLNTVRGLRLRPKEVLPETLLKFGRHKQLKQFPQNQLNSEWHPIESELMKAVKKEDTIQQINEEDEDEVKKFNQLIEKSSTKDSTLNKKPKKEINKKYMKGCNVGRIPYRKKYSWEMMHEIDEWDFKIPEQTIPKDMGMRIILNRKSATRKRAKILDGIFGAEENQRSINIRNTNEELELPDVPKSKEGLGHDHDSCGDFGNKLRNEAKIHSDEFIQYSTKPLIDDIIRKPPKQTAKKEQKPEGLFQLGHPFKKYNGRKN